ncbi:MAG: glycosyltransferase family 9 protein [Candidatus Moranbacteria bacterium]|nr:glycosyltransferase family 9 protein [Candidatus Moranbacteria bacterium]
MLKELIKYFYYLLDSAVILLRKGDNGFKAAKENKKGLFIVKTDLIGDYILFRNFLEELRKSDKFKDWRITVCGNPSWKELALEHDSKWADEFIWLEPSKYAGNVLYRLKFNWRLRGERFDLLLNPIFSKDFIIDEAVSRAARADKKIGQEGDLLNLSARQKRISNSCYDKLIERPENTFFEFYLNKNFVEKVIGDKIDIEKPYLDTGKKNGYASKNPYAVIFPGAGEKSRRWNAVGFARVADYLVKKYGWDVYIEGASGDADLAQRVIDECREKERIISRAGSSLTGFAKVLHSAEILISNETMAVHLAATLDIKTVCISNGKYYGKCCPYPKKTGFRVEYVYPKEIRNYAGGYRDRIEKFGASQGFDLESVGAKIVEKAVDAFN